MFSFLPYEGRFIAHVLYLLFKNPEEMQKGVFHLMKKSIESKFLHQLYFFLDRIDVLDLIRTESCWLLIVYFCKILGLVSCTKVSLNEDYRVC